MTTVLEEVRAERERAHAKHGVTSMESLATTDPVRLFVLTEEACEALEGAIGDRQQERFAMAVVTLVGEVARAFNDYRHKQARSEHAGPHNLAKFRVDLAVTVGRVKSAALRWLTEGAFAPDDGLRTEVVQVTAMADAWCDNLAGHHL